MSKIATIPYEVLRKDGDYEIRSYESFFTASVKESDLVATSGFNVLFSYIGGNNENREKIPMTTPVINDLDENRPTTEFVIQMQIAGSGPPNPQDKNIFIRNYEEPLIAALTFSGNVDSAKILTYRKKLDEWLAGTKLKPTGAFLLPVREAQQSC